MFETAIFNKFFNKKHNKYNIVWVAALVPIQVLIIFF